MSSEDLSKVSEVDIEDKPDLEVLLEKIERGIVESIQRGANRLDTTAQETEDRGKATTELNVAEITNKNTFGEAEFFSSQFRWEFLNPIILYKDNWMGARTEGINLDKGTFRIEYRVSAIASEGTGLALFNRDTRKIERLVSWERGIKNSELVTNLGGTQFLAIYSPCIINITDVNGNFNPRQVDSVYIVTVFRAITLPD